jgi:hypothetical protein
MRAGVTYCSPTPRTPPFDRAFPPLVWQDERLDTGVSFMQHDDSTDSASGCRSTEIRPPAPVRREVPGRIGECDVLLTIDELPGRDVRVFHRVTGGTAPSVRTAAALAVLGGLPERMPRDAAASLLKWAGFTARG